MVYHPHCVVTPWSKTQHIVKYFMMGIIDTAYYYSSITQIYCRQVIVGEYEPPEVGVHGFCTISAGDKAIRMEYIRKLYEAYQRKMLAIRAQPDSSL